MNIVILTKYTLAGGGGAEITCKQYKIGNMGEPKIKMFFFYNCWGLGDSITIKFFVTKNFKNFTFNKCCTGKLLLHYKNIIKKYIWGYL